MAILIEDEKDLYYLLLSEFRYAVKRDNHLAPGTCVTLIQTYLPMMSEPWRSITAKQLANESIQERLFSLPYHECNYKIYAYGTANKRQLQNDEVWESLLRFLLNYLIEIPSEADRYMTHLFGHMDYYISDLKGIDWYSQEIVEQIKLNKERAQKS